MIIELIARWAGLTDPPPGAYGQVRKMYSPTQKRKAIFWANVLFYADRTWRWIKLLALIAGIFAAWIYSRGLDVTITSGPWTGYHRGHAQEAWEKLMGHGPLVTFFISEWHDPFAPLFDKREWWVVSCVKIIAGPFYLAWRAAKIVGWLVCYYDLLSGPGLEGLIMFFVWWNLIPLCIFIWTRPIYWIFGDPVRDGKLRPTWA